MEVNGMVTHAFEKMLFQVYRYLPDSHLSRSVSLEKWYDAEIMAMVLALRAEVYGRKLGPIPADWWQSFKQRWFPKWLLRRFPVRELDLWAIYPQAPPTFGLPTLRWEKITPVPHKQRRSDKCRR